MRLLIQLIFQIDKPPLRDKPNVAAIGTCFDTHWTTFTPLRCFTSSQEGNMRGYLRQDLTFSVRTLIKHLGFTITAVLTLALGIGATTAMFSVVYAVFEPMPYPKPNQLVMVWSKIQGERNSVSPGDYLEWKRRNTSFQDMNAWTQRSMGWVSENRTPFLAAATQGMVEAIAKDRDRQDKAKEKAAS